MERKVNGAAVPQANGDYGVGYCRPPLHTRWKAGQSGNPSGRVKGSKNVRRIILGWEHTPDVNDLPANRLEARLAGRRDMNTEEP